MPFFQPDYPVLDINKVPGCRYRGGKYKLRRWIIRWCPLQGSTYCEPFAGRGNMLFLMKELGQFKEWQLNDTQTIPYFQSVLNYDGSPIIWPSEDEFRERIADGDYSLLYMEPALMWDGASFSHSKGHKVTFAGKHKAYNPRIYRRNILRTQKALKGVELTKDDAVDIIRHYSGDEEAFLYVDPPYLKANVGSYDDGMVNRSRMIDALLKCKCKWLFSEYECDDLLEAFGPPLTRIRKVQLVLPGVVKMGPRKIRYVTECLWSNYPARPFPIDFCDNNIPARISIRLFENLEGKVSLKRWLRSVPTSWPRHLAESEYDKLSRYPWNYGDGKYVWSLNKGNNHE